MQDNDNNTSHFHVAQQPPANPSDPAMSEDPADVSAFAEAMGKLIVGKLNGDVSSLGIYEFDPRTGDVRQVTSAARLRVPRHAKVEDMVLFTDNMREAWTWILKALDDPDSIDDMPEIPLTVAEISVLLTVVMSYALQHVNDSHAGMRWWNCRTSAMLVMYVAGLYADILAQAVVDADADDDDDDAPTAP